MHKKKIIFTVILSILIIASVCFAQSPQITNGISYLTLTKNPDGSWGNDTSGAETLPSTVSVIETLQALNQADTTNYTNALLWLQSQGLETTDYLSERIHALSVAGTDDDLLISYLDEFTYAWGGYEDYEITSLDTALALSALQKINYSDSDTISYALDYLLDAQNSDGGFGFYSGDESNVYMTAIVLQTLSEFKEIYDLQTEINNAAAYLLTKQNPDGGFGSSPSTVYETALSIIALINGNTGQGSALPLQDAINYISSNQLPNGSWSDDPYSTALALRALANIKPNLSITTDDITFSNSSPTQGDTITITTNIKNTGPSQADNVTIQFLAGT